MSVNVSAGNNPVSTGGAYNPFEIVFVAQAQRPAQLMDVNVFALTAFERSCLVIDGTVTRFLEAHQLEQVDVEVCTQHQEKLLEDHEFLGLNCGDTVVSRKVLLRGRASGRVYASASSLIASDRLAAAAGEAFEGFTEGLGRMLRSGRIEQYRELLWYGAERIVNAPVKMQDLSVDSLLTRTYRIIVNGNPVMLITEWFNLSD